MDENVICDVWRNNLVQEMNTIAELLGDYPYVGMDTEFPGFIAHPFGFFDSESAYNYQKIRCDVDIMHIIQIGITLGDGKGGFPKPCCTWQFNFRFVLDEQLQSTKGISILHDSGIDFDRFEQEGISAYDFSRVVFTSGLIMNENITFVTFHSGYDFGYLLELLSCLPLPATENGFFQRLHEFIPKFIDVKLYAECYGLSGGLQGIASDLGIDRVGRMHQAGSDSLITLKTFTSLSNIYRNGELSFPLMENRIYGIQRSNVR